MKLAASPKERIFEHALEFLMVLFALSTIYPFWHLFVVSIAGPSVAFNRLFLFPSEVSFFNYGIVLNSPQIYTGFANTIFRTLLGTVLSVFATMVMAYPMSKRYLPNRNFWTLLVVFTMYFHGGLVPTYLLISKTLNLDNTVWALVLPNLIVPFHMIIARNFLMSIPVELEESAKMDGTGDFRIFWSIILPLSKPIVATLSLWIAVFHWNSWFDALLYITDESRQVLQMILRRVIGVSTTTFNEVMDEDEVFVNPENLKAATVVIATVPILLVYPFIQKYFVKGVMVGSLKG